MKRVLFFVCVLSVVCVPAFANLVVNGDFETGDLTGWTHDGDITVETFGDPWSDPYDGLYMAKIGVDIDPGALEGQERPTQVADMRDLPFGEGEFDGLYAGEIVEHVIDPRAAVREWIRVVRPGGVIVVTTPNAARLLNRVNREREVVNPEHINELSYREIWKLLEGEGLRVVECRGIYLEFLFNYFRRGKKVDLLPRRFGHPRCRPLYRLAMGLGNLPRPFAFDLVFATRPKGASHEDAYGPRPFLRPGQRGGRGSHPQQGHRGLFHHRQHARLLRRPGLSR